MWITHSKNRENGEKKHFYNMGRLKDIFTFQCCGREGKVALKTMECYTKENTLIKCDSEVWYSEQTSNQYGSEEK